MPHKIFALKIQNSSPFDATVRVVPVDEGHIVGVGKVNNDNVLQLSLTNYGLVNGSTITNDVNKSANDETALTYTDTAKELAIYQITGTAKNPAVTFVAYDKARLTSD